MAIRTRTAAHQPDSAQSTSIALRGFCLGFVLASGTLALLLANFMRPGVPVTPNLVQVRFSVAVLSGPKQAEQTAPENVDQVAESVQVTPDPVVSPVVVAERETSLPKAVVAAQTAQPAAEVISPQEQEEVIPPARVSMPGGHLMAEDAPTGDGGAMDLFAQKPQVVFIRLLINAQGKVVRSGIVRSGGDNFRDGVILKAMRSRPYDTQNIKIQITENGEKLWQFEMEIPYGTNDLLP